MTLKGFLKKCIKPLKSRPLATLRNYRIMNEVIRTKLRDRILELYLNNKNITLADVKDMLEILNKVKTYTGRG